MEPAGAQAEVVDEIVELGDEEGEGPEGGVGVLFWEVRGETAAELVVEDYRATGVGGWMVGVGVQVDQRGEVLVAGARTAVEGYQGGRGAGEVAYYFVPGRAGLVGVRGGEGDVARGGFGDGHGVELAVCEDGEDGGWK